MLHAALFAQSETYRIDNWDPHPADRPLVVQFCGNDPATVLAAASHVQGLCDAVELNCGCPQGIAKRGNYGAFLLDDPYTIVSIVKHLVSHLAVPVMVKFRVIPPDSAGARALLSEPDPTTNPSKEHRPTVAFALALQEAGCSVLTLHGRTREQKCSVAADWAAIAAVKAAVTIPVVSNGGVQDPGDIERCLNATQADAVMSSEAALENPAIFEGVATSRPTQLKLAREYIELAREFPPRIPAVVKAHMFKLLHLAMNEQADARAKLGNTHGSGVFEVCEEIISKEDAALSGGEYSGVQSALTWYRRHRK